MKGIDLGVTNPIVVGRDEWNEVQAEAAEFRKLVEGMRNAQKRRQGHDAASVRLAKQLEAKVDEALKAAKADEYDQPDLFGEGGGL